MVSYTIDDAHPPILTAVVGTNADLFRDVAALYIPPGRAAKSADQG